MGFLKDASESILKYSGILVNKTEEYSRIARLNLEIKSIEGNIDRLHRELGSLIEGKADGGASAIETGDESVARILNDIKEKRGDIGAKKKEIEELKEKAKAAEEEEKQPDSAAAGSAASSSDGNSSDEEPQA